MDTPFAMPARTTAPALAPGLRVACWLSVAMLLLLVLATGAGLLESAVYERNPATIIPALRGQDLVTLLALPVFGVALARAWRGSQRATLIWDWSQTALTLAAAVSFHWFIDPIRFLFGY